jgi:hypothetical protein
MTMAREYRPFSEMPIWARLQFTELIRQFYYFENEDYSYTPRQMPEVTVIGFDRPTRNMIFIYFTLDWIVDDEIVTVSHEEPLYKAVS